MQASQHSSKPTETEKKLCQRLLTIKNTDFLKFSEFSPSQIRFTEQTASTWKNPPRTTGIIKEELMTSIMTELKTKTIHWSTTVFNRFSFLCLLSIPEIKIVDMRNPFFSHQGHSYGLFLRVWDDHIFNEEFNFAHGAKDLQMKSFRNTMNQDSHILANC